LLAFLQYNGTVDGLENLASEFENYLGGRSVEQSNSSVMSWFLSGIHYDESYVNRVTNLAIRIQKHKGWYWLEPIKLVWRIHGVVLFGVITT
jgi:hypothetical protein